MKMIPDKTGRFRMRPFWEVAELERMCEETITGLLRKRYGFDRVPVPTEAITVLIERDAAESSTWPRIFKSNLSEEAQRAIAEMRMKRALNV